MQTDRWAMTSAALGISLVGAGVAFSAHLTEYPVLSAQAIRYAIGAGLLYLVAVATGRREPRLGGADWLRLLALALTGMVLFNIAIVRAVTTGAAVVGTIVGVAPVGIALTVPLLQRRRPAPTIVAGAALAAGGAGLVEGFGQADLAAVGWSVVALACEVAFTVLGAPLLRSLSPIGLSIRSSALASLALLVAALLEGSGGFARPGVREVVAIAYLGVASTAVAFVLWYRAMAHLGAERTGLFVGLMPVSAALVGVMVTTASLQAGTMLGALLTGIGLAIGLGRRRGHARSPSASGRPGVRDASGPGAGFRLVS